MSELILLGGGGHAISVLDSIYRTDRYDNILILDPNIDAGTAVLRSKVFGPDERITELYTRGLREAFIGVGSIESTAIRRKLSDLVGENGMELIQVIDPDASVSGYSRIAEGVFVGKKAVVNADVVIGRNAIINTAAVLEHECHIGEFTHIACGSILCGNVHVGADTFIGAGTTVIEGIRIGSNAVIGAGSLVLRDVKDNERVYGTVK